MHTYSVAITTPQGTTLEIITEAIGEQDAKLKVAAQLSHLIGELPMLHPDRIPWAVACSKATAQPVNMACDYDYVPTDYVQLYDD